MHTTCCALLCLLALATHARVINQHNKDCKNLLRLISVPVVEAPFEGVLCQRCSLRDMHALPAVLVFPPRPR